MTEANMRRVGLKLVLAATLTIMLVSTVRQQWNSSKQKLARQMTTTDTLDSSNDDEGDELTPIEESSRTGDRTERIDTALVENSLDTKSTDKNNETLSTVGSENTVRSGELDGGAEDNVPEEEIANNNGLNTLNSLEEKGDGNSQTSVVAEEKDEDTPDYEDSNDHDPNWRATKYSNALYEDEDNEDNYKEDDSDVSFTDKKVNDVADNNIEGPTANLSPAGNDDSRESSMFSWLRWGKYFPFRNSPEGGDQEASQVRNDDSNNFDNESIDGEISQNFSLNANDSFRTASKGNPTDGFEDKTYAVITNLTEYSNTDTNQSGGNNFETLHTETKIIQPNPSLKDLPFEINGIDKANYDDFDDVSKEVYKTQKAEFNNGTVSEQQDESSLQDTPNITPGPGLASSVGRDPSAQEEQTALRQSDQGRDTIHMDAAQADTPFSSYIPQGTQRYHQQTQPLLYERQQLPLLSQLPQRQQFFKEFLPPRILDLILSEKYESSYLRQFPARLQYFIHQKIHRIDQDFDPLTNKETKYAAGEKAHFPFSQTLRSNGPLSSTITAVRALKNEQDEYGENFQTEDMGNNDNYEDINYDNNYNVQYNNNGDYNDETANTVNKQDNIYTPLPDIAIYDNPKPLSEKEFALFRTQPYNNNFTVTNDPTNSPVDVKYIENNGGTDEIALSPQQMSQSGSGNEDETIPCPREVKLATTPHPVTALVAFSDAGTVWVRKMLEQLTGTETDSIYNIMAQLKSGNSASVYQMNRKIAIETHAASDKNFERAVVVIRNPFSVDAQHRIFRPLSVDWQKNVLWNHTYSTWLNSSLPLHVMIYEDLVESPLTELMKLMNFLSSPEMKISYKCAMKIALDPPSVINDVKQIAGIYHDDRRRINQNIDYVIKVAQKTHPEIVLRLHSYKVYPDT